MCGVAPDDDDDGNGAVGRANDRGAVTPRREPERPAQADSDARMAKAREAYEKALALAPNNLQIRQNYELFKEINDRTTGDAAGK